MHPEANLHYGHFVWANFNMADRTAGQLESTLLSATPVQGLLSQELAVCKLYKNSSPAALTLFSKINLTPCSGSNSL